LGPVFIPQKTAAIVGVCVLGTFLLSPLLTSLLRRFWGSNEDLFRRRVDRWAGFVLAGGFFATMAYAGMCTVAAVQQYTFPGWRPAVLERSVAFNTTRMNNVFYGEKLLHMDDLRVGSSLEHLPGFSALRESPKFREILDRPHMKELAARGDLKELIRQLVETTHREHQQDLERMTAKP
jgi:hypothetical protein